MEFPITTTTQPTSTTSLKSIPRPRKRLCSIPGCKNGVVQGGVCVTHGAKRRKCKFPGCDKNSKCAGLCSKHGPPRKKCDTEGCTNVAVQGGKCKSHGANTKKTCENDGCFRAGSYNGYCRQHKNAIDDEKADDNSSHDAAFHNNNSGHPPMSMNDYMSLQMAAQNQAFAAGMYSHAMLMGMDPNVAMAQQAAMLNGGGPYGPYNNGGQHPHPPHVMYPQFASPMHTPPKRKRHRHYEQKNDNIEEDVSPDSKPASDEHVVEKEKKEGVNDHKKEEEEQVETNEEEKVATTEEII